MRKYHVQAISKWKYPGAPVEEWKHFPHELTDKHAFNMKIATLALNGRRLITTKTCFLGLAPEETQNGDVVAVLYGCNFPVVLRRSGSAFKYIGECYIDGLMDGEAIEAQKRGENQRRRLPSARTERV